jgi:hypothetical protein
VQVEPEDVVEDSELADFEAEVEDDLLGDYEESD